MSERAQQSERDGFRESRDDAGVFILEDAGEAVPLILGQRELRAAAKDWETYSSDAPFRVPIPSEAGVRGVRQIPIECDPPQHGAYRKLIEPWFLRPTKPDYLAQLDALIERMMAKVREAGEVDVTSEFALPLQSCALALLLGLPESEAERWIGWGNSLYREGDSVAKGAQLDDYLDQQFARARGEPGASDFFAHLTRLEFEGRRLLQDELTGIANLVFAGGRDTVINAAAEIVAHCARVPRDRERIRSEPKLINSAVEEFVRFVSPLSFIGRVCPHGARVAGAEVAPDQRVGLCFASANHDGEVFDQPERLMLDRKPNPHVGFGSGRHMCLGAAHARAVLRSLLAQLAREGLELTLVDAEPAYEQFGAIARRLGYRSLVVRFA